eukprot:gb/GFBE01035258.1/.p1 GENE.gb/GFBE01035258.1/~~gb/GFBE01035258.1/.p1  ORF type:complete len:554 (+),score=97.14 gb/GFBE01035258.1/:1-1662(+)
MDSDDDDDEKDREHAGMCDAFTSGFKLVRRNCQLGKVLLASGLQMAASSLPETFVLSLLRARVWGDRMSEYMAIASIGINAVAVIFGGPFGRFSDCVDRRLAAAIFSIGTFAPAWSLLIFGYQSSWGLWASTIVKVVGSFGLTSNVMLALVNDVTPHEDREEAVGAFFAANNLLNLVMTGVPVLLVLILKVVPNNAFFFLIAQVVLSILCLILIFSVRIGEKIEKREHKEKQLEDADSNEESIEETRAQKTAAVSGGSSSSDSDEAVSARRGFCGSIGHGLHRALQEFSKPICLACGNPKLRRLWFCAFMLMFAGQLVMDIGGQYFNQSLNLLPYGTKQEIMTVAVLTMIPGQLLAIPGSLITGYLSKRGGPLHLLRRMVPLSAILVTIGAFMAEVRQMWFIAVVVICLNYAGLPNVPLMRLVSGSAPPGRVGEALSAIGIASQLASLIGNVAVAFLNSQLIKSGLFDPLWIYYPLCGMLSLCALIPLHGMPRGGWGAASGLAEEQVHAIVFAHLAQQRWRKEVKRRKECGLASRPPVSVGMRDDEWLMSGSR